MVLPVYVAIPQVQLLDKVVVPVVCTTNALVQVPPFSLVFLCSAWFDSGCLLGVSLRDFLADVPVVRVVQVLMGAVVEETVVLRRLHSLRNLLRGTAHHRVDELMGCIF